MSYNDYFPIMSDNYLYGVDVFYHKQFNEISFYVEDLDQEEMYFNILSKLFTNLSFDKIFPLGGKENVIEEAERCRNQKDKIFIVDKDFDDLLSKTRNDIANLFYLEHYCIENYLIDKAAFTKYIISIKPNLNRRKIDSIVCLEDNFITVSNLLKELIIIYIATQLYVNPLIGLYNESATDNQIDKILTLGDSIEKYIDTEKLELKRDMIDRKISEINNVLSLCASHYEFQFYYSKVLSDLDLESEIELDSKHVCGKSQLKVLFKNLKNCFSEINTKTFDQFVYLLSDFSTLRGLEFLKESVNNYITE